MVVNHVNINRPGIEGIDWSAPLAEQYGVHFTPYYKVYDSVGKLIADGKAASQMVLKMINSTK